MAIGSISTSDEKVDRISLLPPKFWNWAYIMTKEGAQRLPEHKTYDHAIDVKDWEIQLWDPFYALRETELEVLEY
jgi:hypothetical protein